MDEVIDKMIELLLEEKKNYENAEILEIFDRLISNLNGLKIKVEDKSLKDIDKDLNDLDCKCYDLCEVVNLYSNIYAGLKNTLKQDYVEDLRKKRIYTSNSK